MTRLHRQASWIAAGYVAAAMGWLALSHLVFGGAPPSRGELIRGGVAAAVSTLILAALLGYFVTSTARVERERARLNQDLAAANQVLRAIIDASPLAIVSIAPDRRVLSWSAAASRLFGWEAAEVLGRSCPLVPPERENELYDVLRQALSGAAITSMDARAARRDGSRLEVELSIAPIHDTDGGVVGAVVLLEDVTARKRADEARARYELLAASAHEIVLFTDGAGRVLDVNDAASACYGYSREELIGRSIHDLCRGECPPLPPATLHGVSDERLELCHYRRDGTRFPVEITRTVTKHGDRSVVLNLVRDVTHRRRREDKRALLHELDQRILQGQPLDVTLDFVARGISGLFGFEFVQVALKGPEGELRLQAVAGPAAAFARGVRVRWDEADEGMGPTGTAIRSARVVKVDTETDPGFDVWRRRALAFGLRSGLAVPLVANDVTLGAITVYVSEREGVDDETTAALRDFADQAALSVVNARSQERIRVQTAALEAAANAVVITDRNGTIQWVNPAFTRLTGFTPEEALGRTPRIQKSGVHNEGFYEHLWKMILDGHTWRGEVYNKHQDGTLYVEEQTITPVRDAAGAISHFISVKQDVSERKRQQEQIRHLAMHDPLTDLPNRRSLEEALQRAVDRDQRGEAAALLLMDLDHFKVVNDTQGHPAGDRVLIAVAGMLRKLLRPQDALARLGGDEFAVVLERASMAEARLTGERLRHAVEEARFRVESRTFDLTLSIGIAPVSHELGAPGALALADSALYSAKEHGNRIVVFHDADQGGAKLAEGQRLASRIKGALKQGRFVLHFQPVVRLRDGAVGHHEVLIRMRDAGGTLTSSADFLSTAEQFGLMPQIDRWVVHEVLGVLAREPELSVFVNLSGQSLGDTQLLAEIEQAVRRCALPRGQLAFEVTETAAVRDLAAAETWIRRLKELGCLFALDDFGMGFSSFAYLRGLPADYVKIDASFVRNIDTDPTNRALVEAIRAVAHALGKEVIAEAVESATVAEVLKDLAIDHGQGHYFGRPSPRETRVAPVRETDQTPA